MINFKLTIAYDGTTYHGWQVQPGVRTIQGELESAAGRIFDQVVKTHGSGRTDRGVHAEGQVANFTVDSDIQPATLAVGLNALLPRDVRIRDVEKVPPEFHARRSALSKTYRYSVWRGEVVSPFRQRYVYPVRRPLDTEAMDRATARFLGTHDFTSFCAASTQIENRVREIYQADWERRDEEWVLTVRASGFLRYMVRTIVGTVLEVGAGRKRWQEIDTMFAAQARSAAGPSAPAAGLCLGHVEYGNVGLTP